MEKGEGKERKGKGEGRTREGEVRDRKRREKREVGKPGKTDRCRERKEN